MPRKPIMPNFHSHAHSKDPMLENIGNASQYHMQKAGNAYKKTAIINNWHTTEWNIKIKLKKN